MTELCQYLHNWFDRKPDGGTYPKYSGTFTVSGGTIAEMSGKLAEGQYYRVMGSLYSDGVHNYGNEEDILTDEVFDGVIWSMGVPPEIISLAAEISAWKEKYGAVDSAALSPFTSEAFGGYSYSKTVNGSSGTGSTGWQGAFAARLNPWRKI